MVKTTQENNFFPSCECNIISRSEYKSSLFCLQNLANQLSNVFIDTKKVTNHISWLHIFQLGLTSL